jgi:putative aldouronate transport system permease protein
MVFNYTILSILALICVLPFIHLLAISLSKNAAVAANYVKFWPVQFTSFAYEYLLSKKTFWTALVVTVKRVLIGGAVNMILVVFAGYALSKESSRFKSRTIYVWFFFFTMLFTGGIVPLYLLLYQLKMLNTIWALVFPSAVPIFNLILMINFFRQIPIEFEEAALVDGASPFRILFSIYVPCSLPAIATIGLFVIVAHWNSWFDGLIYMNDPNNYPLQSYLQTVIIGLKFQTTNLTGKSLDNFKMLSDRTIRASQIIIATIPILCVYPFLQKYFIKGIILGGVKG